jgi:hypothetical protein
MLVEFKNFLICLRVKTNPNILEHIKIEDSPHFKFVNGDKQPYIDYFYNMVVPIECTLNNSIVSHPHNPKKFEFLIKNFEIEKYGEIIVIEENGNYYIHDGAHRCSILLKKGVDKVRIKLYQ